MSGQAFIFMLTVIIGLCAGILYDIFRLFRSYIRHPNVLTHLQDLIFWLLVTAGMLYVFVNYFLGQIQGFAILGAGTGMILYFAAISSLFLKAAKIVLDFLLEMINRIYNIVAAPIRGFFRLLLLPLRFCFYKLRQFMQFAKKRLQIRLKYVRIKLARARRNAGIALKKI